MEAHHHSHHRHLPPPTSRPPPPPPPPPLQPSYSPTSPVQHSPTYHHHLSHLVHAPHHQQRWDHHPQSSSHHHLPIQPPPSARLPINDSPPLLSRQPPPRLDTKQRASHQHQPPPPPPSQSQTQQHPKFPQPQQYVKHEPQQQHSLRALPAHHTSSSTAAPPVLREKRPLPDRDNDDGMPPTSDFVKKLYRMLEDNQDEDVVSWGPTGDCFIVKDMNEFTRIILPRMFKHSNFASFVRQLNKYDFHKIKNIVEDPNPDMQSWTFQHPDFQANNPAALENIKRKVPNGRKPTGSSAGKGASVGTSAPMSAVSPSSAPSPGGANLPSISSVNASVVPASPELAPLSNPHLVAQQIQDVHDAFNRRFSSLEARFDELSRRYEDLARVHDDLMTKHRVTLNELGDLRRNANHQDGVLQQLLGYFVQGQHMRNTNPMNGGAPAPAPTAPVGGAPIADEGQQYVYQPHFVHGEEAKGIMLANYTEQEIAQVAFDSMNEMSRRAQEAGMTFGRTSPRQITAGPMVGDGSVPQAVPPQQPPMLVGLSEEAAMQRLTELQKARAATQPVPKMVSVNPMGMYAPPPHPPPGVAPLVNGTAEQAQAGSHVPSGGVFAPQTQVGGPLGYGPPPGIDPGTAMTSGDINMELQRYPSPSDHAGFKDSNRIIEVPSDTPVPLRTSAVPPTVNGLAASGSGPRPEWNYGPGAANVDVPMRSGSPIIPPASPPSLSSTDPRPIVNLDHTYPTQPPPPPRSTRPASSTSPVTKSPTSSSGKDKKNTLRVRRSTYVPGWAVPPRVLLVEDDLVSRRLSSKFLQVSGCTIDVAVDGIGAVNKMNLEKYDLVLMDIVMPKLDGISATSLIRQFDHMTPIISMTSNSKPSEIMTYYSSGMNDILPKPFTRDGLTHILDKHLTHLKLIKNLTTSIPRSLSDNETVISATLTVPPGFTSSPPSPSAIMAASTPQETVQPSLPIATLTTTNSLSHIAPHSAVMGTGQINPLEGLGIDPQQYPGMLQKLIGMTSDVLDAIPGEMDYGSLGMGGMSAPLDGMAMAADMGTVPSPSVLKREREDDDMRSVKRSRFEVIE
ncbi:uncharacterized protein EI90DRAFT_3151985 [Cantharellus anzutake]|uniref:uncharacterized protein n=1 Tax=Cantharellus anzutake TaxID=1750568 RepID=UPI001906D66C|nr:uncharacterized protein EI90DRAFT_3151985 [Cantharellus anzutake]KAF8338237.1 hypothetical protein EI90DRAFT_3151985 [Cantharellus anzutake]